MDPEGSETFRPGCPVPKCEKGRGHGPDHGPIIEPTSPKAWGRWAAAQPWGDNSGDVQDLAMARFMPGKPLYPGDPSDVALEAYYAARAAIPDPEA